MTSSFYILSKSFLIKRLLSKQKIIRLTVNHKVTCCGVEYIMLIVVLRMLLLIHLCKKYFPYEICLLGLCFSLTRRPPNNTRGVTLKSHVKAHTSRFIFYYNIAFTKNVEMGIVHQSVHFI